MPQAQITVNGVTGSNDNLPINTLVQLNNNNTGGETVYSWSILDQPPGSADALSSTSIQNPTFTPKKEGTYFIQLIVNPGGGQLVNTVICAIRQLKTQERVPATGETIEDGHWSPATNGWYRDLIERCATDPGIVVGVAGAAGLNRGTIVSAAGTAIIKSGLPGQETVISFLSAPATGFAALQGVVGIVESDVFGNNSPANGALIKVRVFGRFSGASGSPAVGAPVYVSNAAALALSIGTYTKKVGVVIAAGGGLYDLMFNGMDDTNPLILLLSSAATNRGYIQVWDKDLAGGAGNWSYWYSSNGVWKFSSTPPG